MTLHDRFWSKVDKSGDCWIWTGARDGKGYGMFWFRGRAHRAHRVAWALSHGELTNGLQALHHCDNPPCVRPSHLFAGTNDDNMADKHAKGREARLVGTLNGAYGKSWNHGNRHAARLTIEQTNEIRERYAAGGVLQRELAAEFGVTTNHVWMLVNGKRGQR